MKIETELSKTRPLKVTYILLHFHYTYMYIKSSSSFSAMLDRVQLKVPGSKIAGNCRQRESTRNRKYKEQSKFCRGKVGKVRFAVEKLKFCRGKVSFAVEK